VRIATFSSTGRRESNQDRVAAFATTLGGQPAAALAVADGIGGLDGGEEAAALAIEAVSRLASADLPRLPPDPGAVGARLVRTFESAGRAIEAWSDAHPERGPAGSTLTCAVVWRRRYVVAHVGDTRCYLLSARGACPLTDDHTEAARLVRAGRLAPALAAVSPLRHPLTNALGWPKETWVDLVPGDGAFGVLDERDTLLVCSDGVHDVLGPADLAETATLASDPGAAVERLVGLALARGSRDNASVALLRSGGEAPAFPLGHPAVPLGLTRPTHAPKLANGAIV
jgi:serine/threonine protein phosphatase PrpC